MSNESQKVKLVLQQLHSNEKTHVLYNAGDQNEIFGALFSLENKCECFFWAEIWFHE